ncbi:MAG: hypothetical protein KC910_08590 [Candidatus Eremiobacteraeota bacterium]|nr:hypothetical protein [Candidatus Eremiobacteraeota bacterium]
MRNRRGIAIVVVLMGVALVAVIAGALVLMGSNDLNRSFANVQSEKAYFAAEAGGRAALVELSNDSNWPGYGSTQTLPGGDSFEVGVYPAGGAPPPNGANVPSGHVYVLSTGHSANGTTRQVGLLVKIGVGTLDFAVVADQGISLSGSGHIDSMDPLTGLLLPDPANVATNSIADGAITITGGSSIQGDANVGPGAPGTAFALDDPSMVAGVQGTLSGPIPLDPVVLPDDPSTAAGITLGGDDTLNLTPGTFGDVNVSGSGHLILAPGVYVFNSLLLDGGCEMVISDATEIYIADTATVNVGAVVNPTKQPTNLKFFVQSGDVALNGAAAAYYVLYAPTSDVVLTGSSTVFGNLVGKSLDLSGGTAVHFDPSSGGAAAGGGSTTATIASYQRF